MKAGFIVNLVSLIMVMIWWTMMKMMRRTRTRIVIMVATT